MGVDQRFGPTRQGASVLLEKGNHRGAGRRRGDRAGIPEVPTVRETVDTYRRMVAPLKRCGGRVRALDEHNLEVARDGLGEHRRKRQRRALTLGPDDDHYGERGTELGVAHGHSRRAGLATRCLPVGSELATLLHSGSRFRRP